ncbi:hypothetical protein ACLOJK_015157 [Asimina triloba]
MVELLLFDRLLISAIELGLAISDWVGHRMEMVVDGRMCFSLLPARGWMMICAACFVETWFLMAAVFNWDATGLLCQHGSLMIEFGGPLIRLQMFEYAEDA